MSTRIRPFTPVTDADYQLLVDIGNAVHPHMQRSAAELRHWSEARPDYIKSVRLLAEADGVAVGVAYAAHLMFAYQPNTMMSDIMVLESARRKGVGSVLYDRLMAELAAYDLSTVRCSVKEDQSHSLRFADKRGFAEDMREWESILDMSKFFPNQHASMAQKAEQAGIVIKSAREMMTMPGWDRKVHELELQTGKDVPFPDPAASLDFESFEAMLLKSPNFLPDGFLIALDGDKMVGSTNLWKRDADDHLFTGLTGVLREYRRKGIASALKLRALTFAKERGAPSVHTDNATINRPMLAINEQLGFEKQPATILMSRKLQGK